MEHSHLFVYICLWLWERSSCHKDQMVLIFHLVPLQFINLENSISFQKLSFLIIQANLGPPPWHSENTLYVAYLNSYILKLMYMYFLIELLKPHERNILPTHQTY